MKEKAKAFVFRTDKPKMLELKEYPLLPPREGTVLVKLLRTNVCGSDLHMWRGEAGLEQFGIIYPIILGHEMVGRIEKLGDGVTTDAAGERVKEGDTVIYAYYKGCGMCPVCHRGKEHMCLMSLGSVVQNAEEKPHFKGGFAEYYFIRRGQKFYKVPSRLTPELVSGCNCALSQVIHGLDSVGVQVGENVVIQGAGGLGLFATAVARFKGAGKVIVVDGIAARLELAKKFGADEVINIQEIPDHKERVFKVQQLTGGGADVVVEVVGLPIAVKEGVRMLQRGGRYLEIGNISAGLTFKADPAYWVGSNITIHAVSLYPALTLLKSLSFLQRTKDTIPYAAMYGATYPLDQVQAAFEAADALTSDKANTGRVAVVMD